MLNTSFRKEPREAFNLHLGGVRSIPFLHPHVVKLVTLLAEFPDGACRLGQQIGQGLSGQRHDSTMAIAATPCPYSTIAS